MHESGNVTMFKQHPVWIVRAVVCGLGLLLLGSSIANVEVLGQRTEEITRFPELLARPVRLRSELNGVHPRLFFDQEDLAKLREKARGPGRDLWMKTLEDIQTIGRPAPDPRDKDLYKSGLDDRRPGSITQYALAFQIAQTSFAYAIEGDAKYLAAAKSWALAACEMPSWGYTYNKPNVDLPPAHLLYAVAFAYDVLFDKLSSPEKEKLKTKLLVQGRLMYDYFKFKPGKRYSYSQNHTWIPMAGLAIAAYALIDESPEVEAWARLARATLDRTIQTFATDGYFYESFHYYGFAFRWVVRYFDSHLMATGENLYERMRPKLEGMKYFVMHSVLPDRENVFDFADIGDGSLNRTGASKREKIYAEYDIIYRLAGVYRDRQAQAIGDFLRNQTQLGTREPMWAFINRDITLPAAPLSEIPHHFYFRDNDTVFWRSDWTTNATAFAFRCSPPEGHHAANLASAISDWRQSQGHAHPDANSFIIFSKGKYLTGDTGYLGIKQTNDHNTILVNGRGQEKEGVYDMFKDVPVARLDRIRIAEVAANGTYFYARGEASSAYDPALGLKKFDRHFLYLAPDYFVVWDELETEKPASFSFLLNSDRDAKLNGKATELINGDAVLRVVRVSPAEARSEVAPQTVIARGLPGSVDKGVAETRGVQLRTTATADRNKFEFIHLLIPYRLNEVMSLPSVYALESPDKGLRISWPNGDTDMIYFDGKLPGPRIIEADRVVIRKSSDGTVKAVILQKNGQIKSGGAEILSAVSGAKSNR